jgi:hypothetical protein
MQTYYRFSGRIAHSQQTLPLPHLLLQGLLPSSNSRSLPCSLCPRSHENILWTVYTSSGVIWRLYKELHGHDSRGEVPELVLWIDEARAAKRAVVFPTDTSGDQYSFKRNRYSRGDETSQNRKTELQIMRASNRGCCPSIACMKALRSSVGRLLIKLVAKVRRHAIAQQLLHSCMVEIIE